MERAHKVAPLLAILAPAFLLTACTTQPFTVDTAREAAKHGDAQAQYYLAKKYAKGEGVPRDYGLAVSYLQASANQGCAPAENDLGAYYAQGLGVPQNQTEAVKWFRQAAEQGDPLAEFSLGWVYSTGSGVAQNRLEAVKWFERAAAQHQLDAQLALGDIYLRGQGIPANHRIARKWFAAAARQNATQAINALGCLYEQGGSGLAQNLAQAVKYYRQAAMAGDGKGQMNLGRMYLEGTGVPKDLVAAYKWFYLAATHGPSARHYLEELEGTANYGDFSGTPLTPAQKQEAIRQANAFRKMPAA